MRVITPEHALKNLRNLRLKIPSKTLGPKFVGPFKVVQVVNSAAVRLDIPSSWRINSVFHVTLLKKVDTPDKEAMPTVPPVDENGELEISRILDSRWHRGRLQYLELPIPVSDILKVSELSIGNPIQRISADTRYLQYQNAQHY
ncbi:unnamed protein product [Ranitomeya imitator]|uniref:Tf2-1-like SH3-like domain-containing protein n=1 Tax=Ranitomeya imitator TaxID=111125 RepID=A0ABN9MG71_9NEOB|nr:unnamed protein product [Ranitomeya imitator]